MSKKSGFKSYKPAKPNVRNIPVNGENTLLPFLFETLKDQSKTTVKSLLKHGQILVNGKVTTQFDTPLKPGHVVGVSYERGKPELSHPLLRIVWEDDLMMVVDKREGLLAAGNAKVKERTAYVMLMEHLKKGDPRTKLYLVNPLDRETSGLMLFAKNRGVQQLLLDRWNEMVPERVYAGVVEGRPEENKGLLTAMREELPDDKVVITAITGNRGAVVRYEVVKSDRDYSYMVFTQEAGKKNMIREQMAFMGYPVTGDERNGAARDPLGRVALHAARINLFHPDTMERMVFESHVPPAFRTLVKK